ncbi:hypothetical protein BUALT_Bualt10G0053800 [Buddleja alternifolia]|uniref:F-box domain-containing protein n=1 Tax=Buddleja alternifolia TaxID=168488 RepID=A0AAV6WXD2_9LAMI|nr:hypothetical protein BUALT_Bualt10G0053800 [Buddleja alternifolia]
MEDKNPASNEFCLLERLPEAVLLKILFRLPINSIIKLKLVCRWLHMILCRLDFTLNYSKNSPFSTLFLPDDYEDVSYLYLLEISDGSRCFRTMFRPKIPDWSESDDLGLSVVGTCGNGLVGIALYKCLTEIVYICNPITGECDQVAEHKVKEGGERCTVKYGFGFCRSTNNYKVLKIVSTSSGGTPKSIKGEILTVGVDETWRVLANTTIPFSFVPLGSVNLNDALHWLPCDSHSTWILTFDLGEEKAGRISYPPGLEKTTIDMKLLSRNNQLCFIYHSVGTSIVMWRMKAYGVAESWTKDMVLDIPVSSQWGLAEYSIVTILGNGDILLSHTWEEKYTYSYNPTRRKFTRIEARECYGLIDYSPSFSSLEELIKGGHW